MELTDINPWWKSGGIEEDYKNLKKKREFNEIVDYIKNRQMIVITGLRRTGKTVLMHHIIDYLIKNKINAKNIIYFSFDFSIAEIDNVLEKYKEIIGVEYKKEKVYLFLDEIQKLENWQNKIKLIYDTYRNIKIFLSGSSSLFIKKKIKESLAGRSFDFQIFPLRFNEYLEFKDKNKLVKNPALYKDEIKKELKHYIKIGGFLELLNEEDDFKIKKYVKELVIDKIVYIDIPKVFKIDEPELLQTLISIISSSPGILIDYEMLANDLKRNRKTISNYLFYLNEAFIIKKVYNFSKNKLTSEKKAKKFYPSTTAFAFLYNADYGKTAETFVLQNYNLKFFYRKGDKEVDFIDEEKMYPIEVKARRSIDKSMKKSVLDFMKKFKVKEGLIITEDYEAKEEISWFNTKRKVRFIPLWKFLLAKDLSI